MWAKIRISVGNAKYKVLKVLNDFKVFKVYPCRRCLLSAGVQFSVALNLLLPTACVIFAARMKGLFYILLCWVAGNAVSYCIGNYISGNIIGMILLFAALRFRIFDPEAVRPAAKFLLGTMSLFFVPFGVGLMVSYRNILDNVGAIVVASLVSTVAVLLATGWTFQILNKRRQR